MCLCSSPAVCGGGGHLSAVQIGGVDMCRYLLSLLFRLVDADGLASSDLDLSSSPILFLFVCVRVFRVQAMAHRKANEPL